MSHPLVVNIHRGQRYDVYGGRPRAGQSTADAPWGNPFHLGKDGNRPQVVAKHREWLRTQPELLRRLREEMRGKVWGCFCAPDDCHCDVYAEIANDCTERDALRAAGQTSLFADHCMEQHAPSAQSAKCGGYEEGR